MNHLLNFQYIFIQYLISLKIIIVSFEILLLPLYFNFFNYLKENKIDVKKKYNINDFDKILIIKLMIYIPKLSNFKLT